MAALADVLDKSSLAGLLGQYTRLYGSIEKVEAQSDGTVKVHGIASTEQKDDQGEIVRATAMRAAIPDYMKFGAIREMHDAKAAGTAIEVVVDDDNVTRLVAHVVDPIAVLKVKTQTYKGFSIGGRVTERDPGDRNIITALSLSEISLVDRPANPGAVFDCWKRSEGEHAMPDGLGKGSEPVQVWACGIADHAHLKKDDATTCMAKRAQEPSEAGQAMAAAESLIAKADAALAAKEGGKEHSETEAERAAREKEAASKAGDAPGDGSKPYGDVEYADPGYQKDKKKRYPIDTEKHIHAAWSYINKPRNAKRYTGEQVGSIKAKIVAAWKEKIDKEGPPEAEKSAVALDMIKALTDAGRLAHMIMELDWLKDMLELETAAEGDGSKAPEKVQAIIVSLCAFLTELVAEETAEVIDGTEMPHGLPVAVGSANYSPYFSAAHTGDLAKVLADVKASDIAPTSATRVDALHNAAATLADLSKAAEKEDAPKTHREMMGHTVKCLKGLMDEKSQHPEAAQEHIVTAHGHMVEACDKCDAAKGAFGNDKEARGRRHSAHDQEMLDLSYHCAEKASKMDGIGQSNREHLHKACDSLKAAGALHSGVYDTETGEKPGESGHVPNADLPASGDPQANSTVDTNAGNRPGGTVKAPTDNAPHDRPNRVALALMVDNLAKRHGGHQALMDMAHDCVGKVTDGAVCEAQKRGARLNAEDMGHLRDAHDHLRGAGAKCDGVAATERRESAGGARAGSEEEGQGGNFDRQKSLDAADLQKRLASAESEKAELLKVQLKTNEMLDRVLKRVEDIASTPIPPATLASGAHLIPITKQQDGASAAGISEQSSDDLAKRLAAMSPEERTMLMIKASQTTPIRPPGFALRGDRPYE